MWRYRWNRQCNAFANCLTDYNLGVNIPIGTQYTISITQSETVRANCFQHHKLSINAYLEWTCNPNIANIANSTLGSSIDECSASYLMIKSNKNDYKETQLYSYEINNEIIGSKYINELPLLNHMYMH